MMSAVALEAESIVVYVWKSTISDVQLSQETARTRVQSLLADFFCSLQEHYDHYIHVKESGLFIKKILID